MQRLLISLKWHTSRPQAHASKNAASLQNQRNVEKAAKIKTKLRAKVVVKQSDSAAQHISHVQIESGRTLASIELHPLSKLKKPKVRNFLKLNFNLKTDS